VGEIPVKIFDIADKDLQPKMLQYFSKKSADRGKVEAR
jgi:hypothetical protein